MKTKDMNITDKIQITNEDNMLLMARYPDNYFELAIVDPPYGIGESGESNHKRTGGRAKARKYKAFAGNDKEIPEKKYFKELKRVSKNQIIWGGNYMVEHLTKSMGWIFWDKDTGSQDFSDGELAYTSFNRSLKKYKYTWCGFRQGPTNQRIENRIHPTQKPVALYKWLLKNYAKEGDKILDTHLGSGSIAIACHDYKFELTACELDKDYYEASIKRIKDHVKQLTLF
jgi:site-specific DNA-methyltransferase (adenine-specific)